MSQSELQALTPHNSDGRRSEHASACLMLLLRALCKQEVGRGGRGVARCALGREIRA